MVHHYEPESKRQSMEWNHPGSPAKKKFKTQPSAGKVMLTDFRDSKGPILEDYLEKGRTTNSARYSDLLANNLKPAVRTKRRGLLSKKVLLLHDNARPHTASQTVKTINFGIIFLARHCLLKNISALHFRILNILFKRSLIG